MSTNLLRNWAMQPSLAIWTVMRKKTMYPPEPYFTALTFSWLKRSEINKDYRNYHTSYIYTSVEMNAAVLREQYNKTKAWLAEKRLPENVDICGVFANDGLDLDVIDIYGFDYDYTLATYKESVQHLIHSITKTVLVDELKVS